jgi:tRNA modification GTPase
MNNRTIAAISTPIGPGGIGIIRISGDDSLLILKNLFVSRKNLSDPDYDLATERSFSSHHVYHGFVHDIGGGNLIDEVLAFYMKGPNSYTREDVVEIQSHSGYVVLDRILSAVLDAGAELAEPGEFTQKAFLNGRIDLTQAEAVIDLITAPCSTAATLAIQQASGAIKRKIDQILDLVIEINAKCEAMIEFDDSDDLALGAGLVEIKSSLFQSLLPQIQNLIQSQKTTAIFCQGVLMTIAGVPNVGKSSLLNQLVEKEAAIVSEIPGTTRDVIREYLSIKGVPIILCDTAGLHETQDPVECIGINRAHDHIERAELLLFVIEANRELNPFEETFFSENKSKRTIIVVNKVDIADAEALKKIYRKIKDFKYINVSAKTGSGVDELKDLIFHYLVNDPMGETNLGVTVNLRHRKILEKIERILLSAKDKGEDLQAPELIADLLGRIRILLEDITGRNTNEDIYKSIFSQFCVGK